MKICIVGPGIMPIPPTGWGAVEILIWDYKETLEKLLTLESEMKSAANNFEFEKAIELREEWKMLKEQYELLIKNK